MKKCPICNAEMPENLIDGLCPRCVLKQAMQAEPAPPEQEAAPATDKAEATWAPTPSVSGQRVRFGDYELLELIGRGGMGVVYKARQVSLNRTVALKMLDSHTLTIPKLAERLRIEAEAAASLEHPHIVTIYEFGEHGGHPFFTMSLVEGHDLNHFISSNGFRLLPGAHSNGAKRHGPQATAARLLVKIAQAVDYAHQHGVLHRDLKPANILIDHVGEPHLTDFGLAKIIGRAQLPSTGSGLIFGTPGFMAPERASGQTNRDGTSADIYGLGAVLYAMLTGHPPFRAETPVEVLRKVVEEEPKHPTTINPAIDSELATICLKCLEKEPGRRYRSAHGLAEDLERWLRREPIEARPVRALGRVWRWCRREPMIAGMVAGLLLLITAVALLTSTLFLREKQRVLQVTKEKDDQRRALIDRMERDRTRGLVHVSAEEVAIITGFDFLSDSTDKRMTLAAWSPERLTVRMVPPFGQFSYCLQTSLCARAQFRAQFDLRLYCGEVDSRAGLLRAEADLFRLDPAVYVLARREMPGLIAIARESYGSKLELRAAIVTYPESGITNLSYLKGRSFAFGEPDSAIGWHLPRAALVEAGLFAKDFLQLTNLPSSRVVSGVGKHTIDAGCGMTWRDWPRSGCAFGCSRNSPALALSG